MRMPHRVPVGLGLHRELGLVRARQCTAGARLFACVLMTETMARIADREGRVVSGLRLLHDPQAELAEGVGCFAQALRSRLALEGVGLSPVGRPARERLLVFLPVLECTGDTGVGFDVEAHEALHAKLG